MTIEVKTTCDICHDSVTSDEEKVKWKRDSIFSYWGYHICDECWWFIEDKSDTLIQSAYAAAINQLGILVRKKKGA